MFYKEHVKHLPIIDNDTGIFCKWFKYKTTDEGTLNFKQVF